MGGQDETKKPSDNESEAETWRAATWNGWYISTIFCVASILAFPVVLVLIWKFVESDPSANEINGEHFPKDEWRLVQMAFATCLLLDFISFLWTVDKEKKRLFYFVLVINGIPIITYGLLAAGNGTMLIDAHGRRLVLPRYVHWLFTTPAMLYLYSIVSNIPKRELVIAMTLEYIVIILGIFASLLPVPFDIIFLMVLIETGSNNTNGLRCKLENNSNSGSSQICWCCFYQVMKTLNRMLTLAIEDSSDDPAYRAALLGARLFMTVTWVR